MIIKSTTKYRVRRILSIVIVILYLGLVFYLSGDQGSVTRTKSMVIAQKITVFLGPVVNFDIGEAADINRIVHYYLRKTAHVIAYFMLTILVLNALWRNGINSRARIFFSLIIPILVASIDEIYQYTIPSRSGRIEDVFIDAIGILLAITIGSRLLLYMRLRE